MKPYLGSSAPGTGCKHRSLMLWGVADFLWVTDRPPLRLGQSLQKRAYESGMAPLTAYASLSSMNLEKGRVNYKVRPKWFLGFPNMEKYYQTYVKSLQGSIATIWYNHL